jgi:hypothetical protein
VSNPAELHKLPQDEGNGNEAVAPSKKGFFVTWIVVRARERRKKSVACGTRILKDVAEDE